MSDPFREIDPRFGKQMVVIFDKDSGSRLQTYLDEGWKVVQLAGAGGSHYQGASYCAILEFR